MPTPKTACKQCGLRCRVSRAQQTGGLCKRCADGRTRRDGLASSPTGMTPSDIADGMELGMRLLFGAFFGSLLGGLGYALGTSFTPIAGYILGFAFGGAGFVYGCFCFEINAVLRSILPFWVD